MNKRSLPALALITLALATVTACGGGGGSSPTPTVTQAPSGGATTPPSGATTPTPSPTPTVGTLSGVNGTVVSCDNTWMGAVALVGPSPEPTVAPCSNSQNLAGATVTIGSAPAAGVGGATGGQPVAPTYTATTTATGTFSISNVPNGTYELQVAMPAGAACSETWPNSVTATPVPSAIGFSNSGNYAALHSQLVVSGTTTAVGTIRLTWLTQDEWCNYQQALTDRAALLGSAKPATNPVVDEYAEESARTFAIGSETTGIANPSGVLQVPTQLPPQYASLGGLFTYNMGFVGANQSWESSEYETMSMQYAGPSYTSTYCSTTSAWCNVVTKPTSVFLGFSEGPTRGNFAAVSITH